MNQLEELPERKRDQHENVQESEKQPLSSVKSSVFLVQWKPCRETHSTVKDFLLKLQSCLGAVCGMQWYAYATLGITMALLSFLMDFSVAKMLGAQQWLYGQLEGNFLLQFLCWTLYPACLCALAATFCQSICPFSTGSGIPEVRTMLAGIDMPLYLSLTNMFSKFLGLICTLAAGSTVFLGKVGPFVHLSTMFAAYLDNMFSLLQGIKKEKTSDMLVVAAAVGVASCFGAPVSGVLFSVEVMGSHYSLRHYFPCFFSAACGALTFRLFSVWSGDMGSYLGHSGSPAPRWSCRPRHSRLAPCWSPPSSAPMPRSKLIPSSSASTPHLKLVPLSSAPKPRSLWLHGSTRPRVAPPSSASAQRTPSSIHGGHSSTSPQKLMYHW